MQSLKPLISVVVYTYNLESYIEECLDSVYNLNYEHIELIISDDASTDRTVEIIQRWCDNHSNRFSRLEIVIAAENRGQANNLNKGIAIAQGEYIKILAGDDILLPNILDAYCEFIASNSEKVDFIYSNVHKFSTDGKGDRIFHDYQDLSQSRINQRETNLQEQLDILIDSNKVWVATMMFSKRLWEEVKFDERYSYYEDYPFVLNLTLKGYKIYFIPFKGALYRRHIQSVQVSKKIFSNYVRDRFRYKLIEIAQIVPQFQTLCLYYQFLANHNIYAILGNEKSFLARLLIRLLKYYYFNWKSPEYNIEKVLSCTNQLLKASQKKRAIS
jgi:glycosyltransferase involved in cell wall biosynthesis